MCSVSSSKTPEGKSSAGSSGESRAWGDIRTVGRQARDGQESRHSRTAPDTAQDLSMAVGQQVQSKMYLCLAVTQNILTRFPSGQSDLVRRYYVFSGLSSHP